MIDRRVVVTGMGALTPIGNDVSTFWQSLMSGKSGAGPITRFDPSDFTTQIAAEIKDFDPTVSIDRKEARRTDLYTQYAVVAADEAMRDAGFDIDNRNDEDFGVVIGSGIGGIGTFESQHKIFLEKGPGRVSPFFITMMIPDIVAGFLAIRYGLKGPNYSTVSACATSGHAIGGAYHLIKYGHAERMLVGGAEAPIVRIALAGFCANRALSQHNDTPETASRPFDATRDGFVMGEGAGILVIEELEAAKKRGAKIYAEVVGYAGTADAFHITAPPVDGDGAFRAMRNSIKTAGIEPEMIGYVNTHGTSTPTGDIAEINAIKRLFGEHAKNLKVNSTKSLIGHLLGAAAGAEAIATILSICNKKVHPTINRIEKDPDFEGIDLVENGAVDCDLEYAISNSFGFGGHNCSLVFKRFDG